MIQFHAAYKAKDKLRFNNRDVFNSRVSSLPDGPYVVLIMSVDEKSTRDCQNRYFAVLGEWSKDSGETKQFLHEMVKEELFTQLFDEPVSTTELTPEQWTIVFFNLENFFLMKYENR